MMTPMKKHQALPLLALVTLSAALLSAGCSSDTTDNTGDGDGDGTGGTGAGTGGGTSGQTPADDSEASIAAFLAAGTYKTWTADPAPRPDTSFGTHSDLLRVYFNDSAAAASGAEAPPGSMAVKELYSDATTLVGKAVSLRNADGSWTFYCDATDVTACGASSDAVSPAYNDSNCVFCHGNTMLAPVP